MTSRSEQRRGKLENKVTLQIFHFLIYSKLVNLKLKIMRTRLRVLREKLKLDKTVIKEYQSTRKLKLLFLHHLH